MNYIFHPLVKQLLEAFIDQPRSSLLISGPPGSGKSGCLDYLVEQILGGQGRPGEVLRLADNSIDSMRQLLTQLSRTRQDISRPRLAVIDDLGSLNPAAQTILLKTLEEPPAGSHFLLAALDNSLPATIVSRCQLVQLRRPKQADIFKLLASYPSKQLEKAYQAADGWPAAMIGYLKDQDSPINQQIRLAKGFLAKDGQRRAVHLFSKDNQADLSQLLAGLIRLSRAKLMSAANSNSQAQAKLWLRRLEKLQSLQQRFSDGQNRRGLALGLAAIF